MRIEKIDPIQAEKLLKLLTDSIEQGKDFVLEQAPDVVQQLLLYKRIEYTFYAVLFTLIMAVVIYVAVKGFNVCMSKTDTDSLSIILAICGISTIIIVPILCGLIPRLIMVYVTPKVFLLEYLTNIVK